MLEIDYELARLAWLNCYGADPKRPARWILKGGVAIRHTYSSQRFSADADLTPVSVTARGDDIIVRPPELRLDRRDLGRAEKSERHRMSFSQLVGTGRLELYADLNTGRPLRVPPPVIKTFACAYLPPFPVWVASIVEIVGEKSNGLLTFAYANDVDRIKDAFDLWFLLSNGHARDIDKAALRRFLAQLRVTAEIACPTTGLGVAFRAVLDHPQAPTMWNRFVRPLLRNPGLASFDKVKAELPALADRLLV